MRLRASMDPPRVPMSHGLVRGRKAIEADL